VLVFDQRCWLADVNLGQQKIQIDGRAACTPPPMSLGDFLIPPSATFLAHAVKEFSP